MLNRQDLEKEIAKHDHAYWVENNPLISDAEYDALVRKLGEETIAEPAGSSVHPEPMLSLGKCYTQDELLKWMSGVARGPEESFACSPKFDGCAVRLAVGDFGVPVGLFSRGDGRAGEDWTRSLRVVKFPYGAAERGEVVVTKTDFERNGEGYKNPRAMAGGVLNNRNLPDEFPRALTFVPYTYDAEIFTFGGAGNLDFEASMRDMQAGDIPIDGLVISLVDKEYSKSLGATDHHPHGAIALKVSNPSVTAKVVDVEWGCGKKNLTPVVILEPVELDGVVIERATLHNYGNLMKLQPLIGAKVKLVRAGSVIPEVEGVLSQRGAKAAPVPFECPDCGAPTRVVDGLHLRCTNPTCGGAAARKLRDALVRVGIEDCGPKTCSSLVAAGVRGLPDLYRMGTKEWEVIPGFAAASASKMYLQVGDVLGKIIPDWKLVAALNIPGVGVSMAKKLCDRFSVEELRTADLSTLEGIGPNRAAEIGLALAGVEWLDLITTFRHESTKGSLSKPVIVMTGTGPAPRGELEKIAKERGYLLGKAVTKATALLVCADKGGESSKLKKARQYNTEIKTYEEWLG